MSWVFIAAVSVLIAAIVLIEVRAVREGDERQRHAPGYAYVMGGLIVIGIGIAAAVSEQVVLALLASSVGLGAVVLGATRHKEAGAH